MGYAQIRKLHDLRLLQTSGARPGREEILRIVLAIALEHDLAAWCLGAPSATVERWPSTVYRVLAHAALRSPSVWRRCARLLDQTLHEPLDEYASRAPAELVELFVEGRDSLTGHELAAVLWCLLRERCRSHDVIAERLGSELQVVAAKRLSGRSLA